MSKRNLSRRANATWSEASLDQTSRILASEIELVLDGVSDAVLLLDAEWRILYANNRAESMLGVQRTDVIGGNFLDQFRWLSDGDFIGKARPVKDEKTQIEFDEKDPSQNRWYRIRLTSYEERMYVVLTDITELRQAREEVQAARLREKQNGELLETVVRGLPYGVVIFDPKGEIILLNAAIRACHALGDDGNAVRTVDELLKTVRLFDCDDHPIAEEQSPYRRVLAGEVLENLEIVLQHVATGDERVVSFSGVPAKNDRGETVLVIVTVRDVTDNQETQRAIRKNMQRFARAMQATPVAIWTRDLDLKFTWISNPIAGLQVDDIVGKRDRDILPRLEDAERIEQILRKVIDTGVGIREEVGFHFDEQDHIFEVAVEPLCRGDGEMVGIVGASYVITERKKAERLLEEQKRELETKNQQLQGLFDHAPAGLVLFDAEPPYRVLAHNGVYQSFYPEPFRTQGMLGKTLYDYTPRAEEDGIADIFREVTRTGEGRTIYNFLYDGFPEGPVWWHWNLSPVFSDGKIVAFAKLVIDVTEQVRATQQLETELAERKRAEEALRESEKQIRRQLAEIEGIYNAAPVGLCALDTELRYIRVNDRLAQINGSPASEHIGRHIREIIPELAEQSEPLLGKLLTTGEPVLNVEIEGETPAQYGVKRILDESWIPLRDQDGSLIGINVVVEDITEQKRTQEQMARLASIVASSEDAIVRLTPEGVITDWNRSAERIYGYSAEEAIGKFIRLIEPPDRLNECERLLEKVRNGLSVQSFQTVRRTSEGRDIFVSISLSPIKNRDGEIVAISTIERDITPWKEMEFRLRELNETLERRVKDRTAALEDRNRELQNFAYVASHDLQEPLRKIQTFADLMKCDYGERMNEVELSYLERMRGAAARMSQLLSDLLAFSRVTTKTMPFERVNIEQSIDHVLADLELSIVETEAEVQVDARASIDADPSQLRQLLNHLIMNALKFRREGVRPKVSVTAKIEGMDLSNQAICRIVVEDNGIGFDPRYADRIFEPFERLHGRGRYPGTGMGLAICRRIAERHGGSIRAESMNRNGSRFIVELPVAHPGQSD